MGSPARKPIRRTKPPRTSRRRGHSADRQRAPSLSVPDFNALLGDISDAMAVLATATRALIAAEQCEGTTQGQDVGNEIVTLQHGAIRLKHSYDALDVALREVRE